MEAVTSDSELSIDSLEDLRTFEKRLNLDEKNKKCSANTKSGNSDQNLRAKESLRRRTKGEYNTTSEDKSIASSSSSKVNRFINDDDDKRKISCKGSDIYNSGSYFFSSTTRTQSARIPSIRRISRRHSVCFETPESQRLRNRSVSYLEQFKKKHSVTSDTDLKTMTSHPVEPSEVTSLSYVSGDTSEKKTDTAVFDFSEEIVINDDSKVLNSMREDKKQNYQVIPTPVGRKGASKQIKGHPRNPVQIQPNREVINCVQNTLDKRKALEKRDEYSKKVQLRNQIKASYRREKEKAIKFQHSIFKIHCCEQDNVLQKQTSIHNSNNDIGIAPFLINQWDVSATTVSDPCSGKTLTKPVKAKMKTKNQQSSTEVCNISMLQKRHESEKTVVDSIRNSFINR